MTRTNRRTSNMTTAETAYRQGLRRRDSDRAETRAYYLLLTAIVVAYLLWAVGVLLYA